MSNSRQELWDTLIVAYLYDKGNLGFSNEMMDDQDDSEDRAEKSI